MTIACRWKKGIVPALTGVLALLPPGLALGLDLEKIKLPPGFEISLYAAPVPGARSMALGAGGTVFVGSRGAGKVYALVDRNGDQRADEVIVLAQGLDSPNGVAIRGDSLYVAEIGRILRYDQIEGRLHDPPPPVVITDQLPNKRHHGWKFIAFGPDGRLYVPVGAPCNVCREADPRFAAILRLAPDGSNPEIFAHGVRNTVGFDWHPRTGELWFTDNGRDWLGPDRPPDELNRAPVPGLDFGFPFCHGAAIADPEYGRQRSCKDSVPPARELGPHVAALGMRFYTGTMFPAQYRHRIFIAEHGSWNRLTPIGYRLTTVTLEGNTAVEYQVFAEGWLQGFTAWGRPVDVLVMADGALLVSDDKADAIYRISYRRE